MLNHGFGPYFRFAIIARAWTMSPSRDDGLDEGIAVAFGGPAPTRVLGDHGITSLGGHQRKRCLGPGFAVGIRCSSTGTGSDVSGR